MKTTVQGGYRVLRVGEVCNLGALRRDKKISPLSLRVYLGCHILAGSRLGEKRRFTVKELAQRIGGAHEDAVKRALNELSRAEVLSFEESSIRFSEEVLPEAEVIAQAMGTKPSRPIPLPRYILRALARHKRPVEVIAALAHLARLLFKKGAQIRNTGLVKASWIATVFGISERAVCSARRWLIGLKALVPKEVNQFVLNRFGACFIVQLRQERKAFTGREEENEGNRKEEKGKGGFRSGTGSSSLLTSNLRPGKASKPKLGVVARDGCGQVEANFADPLKRLSTKTCTSLNQKNYKPALSGKAGFLRPKPKSPTLKNITTEDLHRLSRLEELYSQAVAAKWLPDCEANFRNFVSAAVRATRVTGDAVRIFVGIVRRGLWQHITQEQEERAVQALKRYREKRDKRAISKESAVGEVLEGLLSLPRARMLKSWSMHTFKE